jgi:hypothetical protein
MSQQRDKSGMGTAPQHEQADLPALADREGVLEDLERVICEAWESFDTPRTAEPQLDEMLIGRLETSLPEKPATQTGSWPTPRASSTPASRPQGRSTWATSALQVWR